MKAGITRLGSYTWLEAGDPLDLICGRMLQVGGMVSFDLETTGLNPWVEDILLVAFTQDGVNSYVFDPAIVDWAPFIKLVETVPCSNHNLREFDAKFIRVKSGAKVHMAWDTMVAYQLATAGICSTLGGASLEELAKKFLNLQLTKSVRKSFTAGPRETTLDQVVYAAEDAQAAHRLIPITRDLLEEAGHLQHMLEIEIPFMSVLEDMEIGGAPFDIDAGLTLLDKIQDEVNQQKAEISAALSYRDMVKKRCPNKCRKATDGIYHRLKKDGGEVCDVCQGIGSITEEDLVVVSPTSRLQVVKAFERLKVKVPIARRNNGSESESISAESLKQIDHPVAKMLIALSTTNKLLTGFMIPLTKPISEGGRYNPDTESIHTTYTQAFTSTNRLCVAKDTILETTKGIFRISDLNEQNIPGMGILTHEGRHRPIKQVFFKGVEPLYRVTTVDGRTITCTKGHRLLTPDGWRRLDELEIGAEVTILDREGTDKQY